MSDEELDQMMRQPLVLATRWFVSVTTGTEIDGALLDVYRPCDLEPTPNNPVRRGIEYRIHGKRYPDVHSARRDALRMGYLRVHEKGRRTVNDEPVPL